VTRLLKATQRPIASPSTIRPPYSKDNWPPDYDLVYAWRQQQLDKFELDPDLVKSALAYYAESPRDFINHWCNTYDPRNRAIGLPAKVPLIMFEKQDELVHFLVELILKEEDGLIEKSRDMGATWIAVALSVWAWLFWEGSAIGWGSRKQELVDRLGDPSSIFEKMRLLVHGLPSFFLPERFKPSEDMHFMRMVNPETGASVIGETGDNIGRGGRTLVYFKDEAAHYTRPESIEAALMDNTRTQVDISSVNGLGNVFYRKRNAGVEYDPETGIVEGQTNVFIMDWSDHPAKDKKWFQRRKQKAVADGLEAQFAREVERNYAASVEGIIIPPEYVQAALDAHIKLGIEPSGPCVGGLDVADEGPDTNAQTIRQGIVTMFLDEWKEKDPGATARRAINNSRPFLKSGLLEHQYDCIGVGASVKSESNRLSVEDKMPKNLKLVAWNAGASVQDKFDRMNPNDHESMLNKDFFHNFKAQAWWNVMLRFLKTWRAINEPDFTYNENELVSIPSKLPYVQKLVKELSQPTRTVSSNLKMMVNKTPPGTKSPNLADSFVEAYFPVKPVQRVVSVAGVMPVGAGGKSGQQERQERR